MNIDTKLVEYIAQLARIKLSETEEETLTTQLSDILKYMDKLKELDTTKVQPLVHPFKIENVFRPDVPTGSFPKKEILANAPEELEGFFKVPKVIE